MSKINVTDEMFRAFSGVYDAEDQKPAICAGIAAAIEVWLRDGGEREQQDYPERQELARQIWDAIQERWIEDDGDKDSFYLGKINHVLRKHFNADRVLPEVRQLGDTGMVAEPPFDPPAPAEKSGDEWTYWKDEKHGRKKFRATDCHVVMFYDEKDHRWRIDNDCDAEWVKSNMLLDPIQTESGESPAETPPVDKRNTGLYRKFQVTRTDGSSSPGGKHENCEYFVLDLDHDKFALPALKAYAMACVSEYPALSIDLQTKIGERFRPSPPARKNSAETAEKPVDAMRFQAIEKKVFVVARNTDSIPMRILADQFIALISELRKGGRDGKENL